MATPIENNTAELQSILEAVNSLPESSNVRLQQKSVTPSASSQEVKPDSGYDGLSKVTVEGDSDLVAGNIKQGVNLFGVTGTLQSGVTVQRTSGSVKAGQTINCGWKPDLVAVTNTSSGADGWYHPSFAFTELNAEEILAQAEVANGFYYFGMTRTNTGFTCDFISYYDFNWSGGNYTGSFNYVAIKYT